MQGRTAGENCRGDRKWERERGRRRGGERKKERELPYCESKREDLLYKRTGNIKRKRKKEKKLFYYEIEKKTYYKGGKMKKRNPGT
jgi:hypothetical protein